MSSRAGGSCTRAGYSCSEVSYRASTYSNSGSCYWSYRTKESGSCSSFGNGSRWTSLATRGGGEGLQRNPRCPRKSRTNRSSGAAIGGTTSCAGTRWCYSGVGIRRNRLARTTYRNRYGRTRGTTSTENGASTGAASGKRQAPAPNRPG